MPSYTEAPLTPADTKNPGLCKHNFASCRTDDKLELTFASLKWRESGLKSLEDDDSFFLGQLKATDQALGVDDALATAAASSLVPK